jgi:pRiA4b ORF-3-like protein
MSSNRRSAPRIYELTLRLSDVEPAVWRRLRVSSGVTLGRAARLFAVSMGWTAGRPYAFTVGSLRYEGRQLAGVWEDVVDVRLRQVLPDAGTELEFEYGSGHAWHLVVRLDWLLPANEDARVPVCVDGGGETPPVDVGGPWAYEEWRSESSFTSGAHAEIAEIEGASDRNRPILRFNPEVVNAELERLK